MNTQDINAHLQPVAVSNAKFATAAEAVTAFVLYRTNQPQAADQTFTADQLRFYVNNNTASGVSPSSADRVLRNLRFNNKLNYIVLNRGKSLYRAVPVAAMPEVGSTGHQPY